MSDPISLPSGQQVQNTQQTVGIGQTFAAQPLARSDAPRDGMAAGPLSEGEMSDLRKAISERGAVGARDWWNIRNAKTTEQGQPGAEGSQPPADGQDPTQTVEDQNATAHMDEIAKSASHGQVTGQHLLATDAAVRPIADEMAALSDQDFNARWDRGMADTLSTIYKNDADAFAEALGDVTRAAYRLSGGDATAAKKLLNTIDASGVLSQPTSHARIVEIARKIIGRKPGSKFFNA